MVNIDKIDKMQVKGDAKGLIKILLKKNSIDCRDAAKALGAIGDVSAIPALIEILKSSGHFEASLAAAEALGEIGDFSAVPALVNYGLHNKRGDNRQRRQLFQVVGDSLKKLNWSPENESEADRVAFLIATEQWEELEKIGASAIPALVEVLSTSKYRVRSAAAKTLGTIGDMSAVPALVEVLKSSDHDSDYESIKSIAEALGKIIDASATYALIEVLESCLYYSLSSLNIEGSKVNPYHYDDYDRDINKEMKVAIVEIINSLGKLGAIAAAPALIKLIYYIEDHSDDITVAAVKALGSIGEVSAIPSLVAAFENEIKSIDFNYHQNHYHGSFLGKPNFALTKFGDNATVALVEVLKNENINIRRATQDILIAIGVSTVPLLVTALKASEDRVRCAAAKTLGIIGDTSAISALVQTLSDIDNTVRRLAAEALEKMHWIPSNEGERISFLISSEQWEELVNMGKNVVSALVYTLNDENKNIRKAAGEALKKVGPSAISEIIQSLKSRFGTTAYEIGDKYEVPTLVQALCIALQDDSLFTYRKEIARILYELNFEPKTLLEQLVYAIALEDWSVVSAIGNEEVYDLLTPKYHEYMVSRHKHVFGEWIDYPDNCFRMRECMICKQSKRESKHDFGSQGMYGKRTCTRCGFEITLSAEEVSRIWDARDAQDDTRYGRWP